MTLKIYSKGERLLRIEVIVRNTKAYRWGRSLPAFPEIVGRLHGIPERFPDALGCINACFVSDKTLENLPLPAQLGQAEAPIKGARQTKVGGIDLNKPRMRRVAEARAGPVAIASRFHFPESGSTRALDEQSAGDRPWGAPRGLRCQETPGQRHGPQNRKVTAIRTSSGRTPIAHGCRL